MLQHAWAELAHDRSFKFGPGLPAQIQRRLNLYAGMLEVVDSGFDAISNQIDAYKDSLESKSAAQIASVEISTLSLEKFVLEAAHRLSVNIANYRIKDDLLKEMKNFGLKAVGDVERLLTREFISIYRKYYHESARDTNYGFIRSLMMYEDIDRYFSTYVGWGGMDNQDIELLA